MLHRELAAPWLVALGRVVITTELPEYMLVELARGLNPGVINAAGAATHIQAPSIPIGSI